MADEAASVTTRAIRVTVLVLAAAPRVWAAFADQGLFWPDEFFQTLEQGHRFAFGYGIVPWEFVDGARSWLFPGLIGLFWKMLALFGVSSGPTLIVAAKLMMVAACVASVEGAMRLGQRIAGTRAALLAGVMVASFPALVLFGSKCMTETASGPLLMGAALLSWTDSVTTRDGGSRNRMLAAGALAALAIHFRYQNGLVTAGLLAILASQRRWRDSMHYAIGATTLGLAGGMLDVITWGRPFHAFIQYAKFHVEHGAAPWGSSPFGYYLETTWHSAGPASVLIALGLALATRRAWRHVLLVAVYVLVHATVPHKEYRFLMPIAPIALTLAAAGLAIGIEDLSRAWATKQWRAHALTAAVALAIGCGFVERTIDMTFEDLGHGDGLAAGLADGSDSPWHAAEGINRLLWKAGAARDTCGVVIKDIPWSSTGAYAYLHKDVPLLFDFSDQTLASANVLIARREFHQPWQYAEGAESRGFMLFHREGPCAPPPKGYTRFVPP